MLCKCTTCKCNDKRSIPSTATTTKSAWCSKVTCLFSYPPPPVMLLIICIRQQSPSTYIYTVYQRTTLIKSVFGITFPANVSTNLNLFYHISISLQPKHCTLILKSPSSAHTKEPERVMHLSDNYPAYLHFFQSGYALKSGAIQFHNTS